MYVGVRGVIESGNGNGNGKVSGNGNVGKNDM